MQLVLSFERLLLSFVCPDRTRLYAVRTSDSQVKDAIKDGVIPATVTPLTPDLDVAADDLHAHINTLSTIQSARRFELVFRR